MPFKGNTRTSQNEGMTPMYYQVTNTKRIKHLDTKQYVSSVKTNKVLTNFLAPKLTVNLQKHFVIVFARTLYF